VEYLKRSIESDILEALQDTPVVVITGPRQAGKTTLIQRLLPEVSYLTLDDENTLLQAINDPIGLLHSLPRPIAIDEIQRAPELTRTIKLMVDKDRAPGSFILTGSANLMTIPTLADSLAGRAAFITLYPFSQTELLGSNSNFLQQLYENNFSSSIRAIEPADLIDRIVSGGYPEAVKRPPLRRVRWHRDYEMAILQRDIKEVFNLQKIAEMDSLIRVLAAISSQTLSASSLAKQVGVDTKTVQKYVTALESLYIVHQIPGWHRNELKRAVKAPKIHFIDTGLMCSIRGLTSEKLMADRTVFGGVFETFVGSELRKAVAASMEGQLIYHYRDNSKKEVDFIVAYRDGRNVGLEVKSGMTIKKEMFSTMEGLIRLGVISHGVIVYTGDKVVSISPQLCAVPVSVMF